MTKLLTNLFISLLLLVPAISQGQITQEKIADLSSKYFQKAYQLLPQNIHVEVVHLPAVEIPDGKKYKYSVKSADYRFRPGRQMIWLTVSDGQSYQRKVAVPIHVTVFLNVLVAKYDIDRNSVLNTDDFSIERVRIDRDAEHFVSDVTELDGMMAGQKIQRGDWLRPSMIRETPDVFMGDEITIQLVSGKMTIETGGTARQSGKVGESIRVTNEATGKILDAEIVSADLVKIEL